MLALRGDCCRMISRDGRRFIHSRLRERTDTEIDQVGLFCRHACVTEAMVHDLRVLLRNAEGRRQKPTASVFDSRTLQSTPESGGADRAGYDGAKRKKGSKLHMAVDTLGHLLTLFVTPADERLHARVKQDRRQVDTLCEKV